MSTPHPNQPPRQKGSPGVISMITTGIIVGVVLLFLEHRTDLFQQPTAPAASEPSPPATASPDPSVPTATPALSEHSAPTLDLAAQELVEDLSAWPLSVGCPTANPPLGGRPIEIPLGRTGSSADPGKLRTEFGVSEDGLVGMVLGLAFNVYNLADVPCVAAVYFYDASGEALPDVNGRYATSTGTVSACTTFTPDYPGTAYDYLEVFMPFKELHLGTGSARVEYCVHLYEQEGGELLAKFECGMFQIGF